MSDENKTEGRETFGALLAAFKAMAAFHNAAEAMDASAWELIEALTNDPREFPGAVKIGTVETDVARLWINGDASEPLEIQTGADGSYAVYADNYKNGFPGRIIIQLHREVFDQAENDRGDECIVPMAYDMLEDDPYYQEGRDERLRKGNEGGGS